MKPIQTNREQELITAIEIQEECMYDLKRQIDNKEELIQLQHTLLSIREMEIEKLKRELHTQQMENNWKWN